MDSQFQMSAGQGTLPAPGGALGVPDVGSALDELFGNKGKGAIPGGPPPDDGEDSNPIGDLFDKVTGRARAREEKKAKQKELLDKLGGKNPARDKWLFENGNIDSEAFLRASSQYKGPFNKYFKMTQVPEEIFFNVKNTV